MNLDIDHINRSAISRATGIDLAHISRIFNRKSKPSIVYARKIANYLDITTDELCDMLGINGRLRRTTKPKRKAVAKTVPNPKPAGDKGSQRVR